MILKEFLEVLLIGKNQNVFISIENNEGQPSHVFNFQTTIETANLWTENFNNKKITVEKEINLINIIDNNIYISLKP